MDGGSPARRRWLKLLGALIPAMAFVALLTAGVLSSPTAPTRGHQAPAFTAPRLDGDGILSLSGLLGKPVVLNFWASWCGPCRAEAPLLRRAYKRYGNRIQLVGVDIHDARSDALAFVRRYQLSYPMVFDEVSRMYRDYGLTGQPETFFIDARGTVVGHVPGELSSALLRRELRALMARSD
jgi:cytochrome c biogenesis protein CcmG, thiol:disulfide interchange protein DsbE